MYQLRDECSHSVLQTVAMRVKSLKSSVCGNRHLSRPPAHFPVGFRKQRSCRAAGPEFLTSLLLRVGFSGGRGLAPGSPALQSPAASPGPWLCAPPGSRAWDGSTGAHGSVQCLGARRNLCTCPSFLSTEPLTEPRSSAGLAVWFRSRPGVVFRLEVNWSPLSQPPELGCMLFGYIFQVF